MRYVSEETLYRRALRLQRWVRQRWGREKTSDERARTVHAHAIAGRLRRTAVRLSTGRAIDRLEHALELLDADNPAREHVAIGLHALTDHEPRPTAYEAYVNGESGQPARVRALLSIASALDHAAGIPAGARIDLEAARVSLLRQERRAIPIETVREYVDDQLAQAEAAYERVRNSPRDPRNPEWSTLWTRYAWLHWLERKSLRRAERAGVGAVLALELDDGLLEQLALLGEQLHEQNRIERGCTTPVDTVPRDLTQDAVEPYWAAATVLSASAEGWRRYPDREILASRVREKRELDASPGKPRAESDKRALQDLEHRLWQAEKTLGSTTEKPGLEAVHRYVDHAGGGLTNWRALYDLEETDERMLYEQLDWARDAARAAVAACREAGEPVDPDELQSIAKAIEEACRRSLEHRLWQVNKALGGSNPHRGVEAVHGHAERAACHVAAWRVLGVQAANERDRQKHLDQARDAAHAAVAACPVGEVPALDRIGLHEIAVELEKIAAALDAEAAAFTTKSEKGGNECFD